MSAIHAIKHTRKTQVTNRYNTTRKRCKIGGKLLLTTDKKSHMSVRLVGPTKIGNLEWPWTA